MHSTPASDATLSTQLNAETQVQDSPVEAHTGLSDSAGAATVSQSDTAGATGSAAERVPIVARSAVVRLLGTQRPSATAPA